MPDIRHAIVIEAPPDRIRQLVATPRGAERGTVRPLFTKDGMETSSAQAY